MSWDTLRPTVALLGEAGLPYWAWDEVRGRLAERSYVVDYLGGDASMRRHAQAVLDGSGNARLILVAHGLGGVLATHIAARAPARVAGIIGIAAYVPPAGRSVLDTLSRPAAARQRIGLALADTTLGRRRAMRELTAQLGTALATRMTQDEPGRTTGRFWSDAAGAVPAGIPAGYVLTADDPRLSPARQERYASTLGAAFRREVPGGHYPMLDRPGELSAHLTEFIADCPA